MAIDFEYDGMLLSDFGFMICDFGSGGVETAAGGSKITFATSPILNGNKHLLTNAEYTECIGTTFSICKIPCAANTAADISVEELTALSRWLNRKEFCKFKLLEEGFENIYFEGSFNLDKIMLNDRLIGLELTFSSNRPFAVGERLQHKFNLTKAGQSITITDRSDEIGFLYLDTEITCRANGTLTIHNDMENRDVIIKNCISGEVISMNYPVIKSSAASHKIQNDFNYNFLRIANQWNAKNNKFTFSLPCSVKVSYHPIRKVSV